MQFISIARLHQIVKTPIFSIFKRTLAKATLLRKCLLVVLLHSTDQSAPELKDYNQYPGTTNIQTLSPGSGGGRDHQNKINKENEERTWDSDPLITSWKWTRILRTSKNHLLVELSLLIVVSLLFSRSSISHHSLYKTWQELLVWVCSPERWYKFVKY